MATVVEISATEGFILDDPVYGVLDTSELGGTVWKDVSSSLITANINRGKSRRLDRFQPGRLSVTFNNEDRRFDPNYTGSDLYGDIIPRRDVRVTIDGIISYYGTINDYNFDYDPDSTSKAQLLAQDDLSLLSRQFVTAGTVTEQLTGARVSAVLDMASVDWDADARSIDVGNSTLATEVLDGDENALDYLNKIATSEQGNLFVSKSGDLVFSDREDATPKSGSITTFADDGAGIPYTRARTNYGTELLINTVTAKSSAGSATALNQGSRTTYGVTSTELDTLLSDVTQLGNIASFYVAKYSVPEYRIESVEMNLNNLSTAQKNTVLGLEISDITKFVFTPNGIGDPIEQFGQIINIDHKIRQDRHDVIIGVTSIDWTFLVLDDALFGILDTAHLAF